MARHIFNFFMSFVVIFLLSDFIWFWLWVMSGQHPVDGYYAGVFTHTLIKLIF